ncbi:MAG: SsrA-binding protein SmpB [Bacteroidota bacterium]
MAKKSSDKAVNIVNRKAKHEYFFDQVLEAGIVLQGTEIKSIRIGNAGIADAYCHFKDGELFVKNLYIAEYQFGTYNNHEPRRDRKLLLKKTELRKLERRVKEKGFTLVPYRLFISERGYAKIEVALARGKKSYDKRETIKDRDNKRQLDRLKKMF